MDLGIRGRKAIVNGGSGGLGKGSALALAAEGVDLTLAARGEERLQATAEEIRERTGANVTCVAADHSTTEGRERILAACPEPDILVSTCSPPPFSGDFRAVSTEDWMEHLAMGLVGPVEFMKAVVDGMAERRFGRIVNITTGASKYPAEIRILSGPPRAALSNYTTAVSKVVARHNVAINNLLPGMHHTDAALNRFGKQAEKEGRSYDEVVADFCRDWRIPAERFGDPEAFGAICAMLCSAHASYVIGQDIVVDGGVGNSTF